MKIIPNITSKAIIAVSAMLFGMEINLPMNGAANIAAAKFIDIPEVTLSQGLLKKKFTMIGF